MTVATLNRPLVVITPSLEAQAVIDGMGQLAGFADLAKVECLLRAPHVSMSTYRDLAYAFAEQGFTLRLHGLRALDLTLELRNAQGLPRSARATTLHVPSRELADAQRLVEASDFDSLRSIVTGISAAVHNAEEIALALSANIGMLIVSPVFAVANKGAPLGLAGLANLARKARSGIPDGRDPIVIALGGITPERIAPCLAHGADGVAVSSFVWSSSNPKDALTTLAVGLRPAG